MYQLKVNQQQSIIALQERGWSTRRIARELGLDRGTVEKYLAGHPKPAMNPQTGSIAVPGPASLCDPWREQIEGALERGLSVQRIYQDLAVERQYAGSYFSVRRFVLRRVDSQELPFRRMECAPGKELQVDFGLGACVMEDGKRRRPHLLRAVLGHLRKDYDYYTVDSACCCRLHQFLRRVIGGDNITTRFGLRVLLGRSWILTWP